MPFAMLLPMALRLPISPERSPVAVMPLVSQHCARAGTPLLLLTDATEGTLKGQDSTGTAQKQDSTTQEAHEVPTLLQLLPNHGQPLPRIPDLNDPIPQASPSQRTDMQVYVRRSLRLQKVHDGERVNPVERASR